jgi:KDO2-lipid IV(A) lauroyltransferase
MRYRIKHICEYMLLRGAAALLNALPYRAALVAGWCVAALAFALLGRPVREACRRMQAVFGNRFSARDRRRMAWISLRNTVFNAIEVLRLARLRRSWFDRYFDCADYVRAVRNCTDGGRGAVIACPHMGNWELAGVACRVYGVPIFNIAARQRNPLVNVYFNRARAAPGIESVERGTGSMRHVLRLIKQGKALAILPDSRMRRPAMELAFLGGTANLGAGMAAFARHADVPVFPGIVTRQGWTRHRVRLCDPVYPDQTLVKAVDMHRMMKSVVDLCDRAVREQPEQWFWYNKRWVLDPVEGDAVDVGR